MIHNSPAIKQIKKNLKIYSLVKKINQKFVGFGATASKF